MMSTSLRISVAIYVAASLTNAAVPEPNPYLLSFPTEDNPLNIKVNTTSPESNYILLIGDWGAHDSSTSDVKVQTAIANKMKTYYTNQKAKGYNLLFVGTVGDNFYYDGQNCDYWTKRWTQMYGELATDYPWLAVMGNHDWGQDDPHAICSWGAADIKYTDPVTHIPYAGNQINGDKKGCNPSNYYLPDYGYYYTINALNFEWIGLEQTATICPDDMGDQQYKDCNNSAKIGCAYLGEMKKASELMLAQRANVSMNSNFLISQHYPSMGKKLVDSFVSARGNKANAEKVWSAYGHTHKQACDRTNKDKECDAILTGGGGGCCSTDTLRGFFVIGFDENKNMIQPLKIDDEAISCQYPCGAEINEEDVVKSEFFHCCSTSHGRNCELFDLTKC